MSRVGPAVEALTARLGEDGAVELAASVPGPAGVATMDVLDGTGELLVDAAAPDTLVTLRLGDPDHPAADRLVEVICGPEARWRVGDLRRSGALDDRPQEVWRRADDDRTGRRRGTAPGGLGALGHATLATAELTRPGRSDLAVAFGLLEAGMARFDLRAELRPRPTGQQLLEVGLARWDGLAPPVLADLPFGAVDRLVSSLPRWAARLRGEAPALADALARLTARDRLDQPPDVVAFGAGAAIREGLADAISFDVARARPMLVSPAPAAAPAAAAEVVASKVLPPTVEVHVDPALDVRVVRVERDGAHLTVHLGGLHDVEAWVRAFRSGETPALVALAPVADGGRARWRTAVALVGPLDDADLLVDVTTRPAAPWLGPANRSVARATRLGADAARLGRLDAPGRADAWSTCADAWRHAGDPTRAARADDLARADERATDAFLVDLLP